MAKPPTPARIAQLPEVLANQIAAGEVVERPAAVVKELVENSIDAGATDIRVDIEGGGVTLIRVRDNGAGIAPDDLVLAVSRHATSKLHSFEDLQHVATLGFRGEALPSIASVAKVCLKSRTHADELAYTLELAGSASPAAPAPCAHPPGTTVEVRELFFNTPARRRFVRTERTEFLHIEATLKRIALAAPEVRIALHAGTRRVFDAPPASAGPARRLQALLGKAFADDAVLVEDQAADMRLTGWVSRGGRAHDDIQYMSVNGRGVRDPVLRHAVRAGFAEHLFDGRQAGFVLALQLPATSVDVNVHPTKHELRFKDVRAVHEFLVSAISGALGQVLELAFDEVAPGTDAEVSGDTWRPAHDGGAFGDASMAGTAAAHVAPKLGEAGPGYSLHHPLAGGRRAHATSGVATPAAPAPGRWVRELAPAMVLTSAADAHYLVDFRALAPLLVQAVLAGPEDAPGRRAQPLLLPHAWRPPAHLGERIELEAPALRASGLELRRSGTHEWLVVSVPRVLQPVALDVLLGATQHWLDGDSSASLIAVLAQVAADAAPALGREALESWLALAGTYAIDSPRACARLDRALLERLFEP